LCEGRPGATSKDSNNGGEAKTLGARLRAAHRGPALGYGDPWRLLLSGLAGEFLQFDSASGRVGQQAIAIQQGVRGLASDAVRLSLETQGAALIA